jgi:uncharacterized protein
MKARHWIGILALPLAACASVPPRYYTLTPEPTPEPASSLRPPVRVEVDSVSVPPEVDRMELITRRADGEEAIEDGERWNAPHADELRSALSLELARNLASSPEGQSTASRAIHINVAVERFESAPSRYTLIELSWSMHPDADLSVPPTVHHARVRQEIGPGYGALVMGHQRALALVAAEMADQVRVSQCAGAPCAQARAVRP